MFESTTMRLLFYACTLSTLLLLAVLLPSACTEGQGEAARHARHAQR